MPQRGMWWLGLVSGGGQVVLVPLGHAAHDFHCLDAHCAHPLQKVYDLFFVIGEPVGVEAFGDGGILWFLLLVLV